MRIDDAYFEDLLFHTDPLEAVTALDQFWSPRLDRNRELWGLAKPEHHVHVALIYTGEVGNGGHAQFFMNRGRDTARRTMDALREMGLADLERCLADALRVFPSSEIPDGSAEVVRVLSDMAESELERLEALDEEVYAIRDTDRRLLDFLRRHRDEILRPERGLDPR